MGYSREKKPAFKEEQPAFDHKKVQKERAQPQLYGTEYLFVKKTPIGRIRERSIVEACAEQAGLRQGFVEAALSDESTIQDVINDHQEAVERYHAFGVPTIAIEGSQVGYYGPIIHTVPSGEEAAELWDYTAWALKQSNIFELKRDRAQAQWGPVSATD